MDGWMDGLINGCMNEQLKKCTNEQTSERINESMDGGMQQQQQCNVPCPHITATWRQQYDNSQEKVWNTVLLPEAD